MSLADAHFQAMGERGNGGGTLIVEKEDGEAIDSTGDTGTLGGYR